jgi:hypothetical protein
MPNDKKIPDYAVAIFEDDNSGYFFTSRHAIPDHLYDCEQYIIKFEQWTRWDFIKAWWISRRLRNILRSK